MQALGSGLWALGSGLWALGSRYCSKFLMSWMRFRFLVERPAGPCRYRACNALKVGLGLGTADSRLSTARAKSQEPRAESPLLKMPRFAISADPLDVAAIAAAISTPACGAIATFVGVVRDHNVG